MLQNTIKASVVLLVFINIVQTIPYKYHNYTELTAFLKNFTTSDEKFTPRLYSIGKSTLGKELWAVEISAVRDSRMGTPNVKLIGNIHGNEAAGREILLHFLDYLVTNYAVEPQVRWLMDNTKVHILPSLNPDGFEKSVCGMCNGTSGRSNAKGIDLNRDFPDYFRENRLPVQPEMVAIRKWMSEIPFILSASLHSGALVANYPFDTVKEYKWEKLRRELQTINTAEAERFLRDNYIASLPINPPSITPDDDVFVHLAKTYANSHPEMHKGHGCGPGTNFTGGITNGAAWYPFTGGMQDYNYVSHGCMELTLEISCCKYPIDSQLQKLWKENFPALLNFLSQAHRGVRGTILDATTKAPVSSAILMVSGRSMNFTTTRNGEFWRVLLPGNYRLEIYAPGYYPKIISFKVIDYKNAFPKLTNLQVLLLNETTVTSTTTATQETTSPTSITLSPSSTDGETIQIDVLENNLEASTNLKSTREDKIYSKALDSQTKVDLNICLIVLALSLSIRV